MSSTASSLTNAFGLARKPQPYLVAVGEVIDGRFEIDRVAASGGMGTVYRAYDIMTDREVALKVLHSVENNRVHRFAREVKVAAQIDHPAIVKYIAHGTTRRGASYLALEWLDGEDLASRLIRGPMPLLESLALVKRIAEALHELHRVGVVHRDIKPANVFLCGHPPTAKLLDFGVVRVPRRVEDEETSAGSIVGTINYMAPEQARALPVDARADIFSLGCVLYECLTGECAFDGVHAADVITKLLIGEVRPPSIRRSGMTSAIDSVAMRMLAKDPDCRPSTAREVVMWMNVLMNDVEEAAAMPTVRPPRP